MDEPSAHSLDLELANQRSRAHERMFCAAVKPTFERVSPGEREVDAGAQVLGEPRVEAGGEAPASSAKPSSKPETEWPLGCDMNGIGFEPAQPLHRLPRITSDSDL